MPVLDLPLERPFDLVRTLAPLARGRADATIRIEPGRVAWATRTPSGGARLDIRQAGRRLTIDAVGTGGDEVLGRLPALLGLDDDAPTSGDLRDAPDRVVRALAARSPGIRIPRTGAVIEALVPAILEQKVTGDEARRAWRGLVRRHGEAAPGPADGLRLPPGPATLAALPYHAYHPFGVEARRARLIRAVAARAPWFEACATMPVAAASSRLTSVSGIGPWTAAEVAVRAFGDVDAVSVGDFHLSHLVGWALAREPRADDARMLELLAPYAGRRALVIRLLETAGIRIPRYGPRCTPRRIEDL